MAKSRSKEIFDRQIAIEFQFGTIQQNQWIEKKKELLDRMELKSFI